MGANKPRVKLDRYLLSSNSTTALTSTRCVSLWEPPWSLRLSRHYFKDHLSRLPIASKLVRFPETPKPSKPSLMAAEVSSTVARSTEMTTTTTTTTTRALAIRELEALGLECSRYRRL